MYSDTMRRTQMVAQRINSAALSLGLIWSVPLKRVFAMNSTNICPRDMGRLTHAVMEKTASDKRSIACIVISRRAKLHNRAEKKMEGLQSIFVQRYRAKSILIAPLYRERNINFFSSNT